MAPDRKKRVFLTLVAAAIALGLLGSFFWPVLKELDHSRQRGGNHSAAPQLIFGGVFLVMVIAVIVNVVRGIRKGSNLISAIQPLRDAKPWLARADWAAGKIKSTTGAQTRIYAIMALAFCGMGGLFTFVMLPKELSKGNYLALLILLFPAIGIGFVMAMVRAHLARRRFGDCFFELAQIPAPLGGTLDGMIQTGARLRPEHGLHLKLSCLRRTVSGSGEQSNVSETILWQDEKVFKSEADLPEPEPGRSGIPIFFKIPADQPECVTRGNETVLWRLEAKAKMRGPDFAATFDVPVFKVAGEAVAEAKESDPTVALQMPVEELRRDENSRIQVTDGPGGRDFYFPAARNLGTATGLTVFFLVWTGVFLALLRSHAPVLFPIVWGVTDALVGLGCFNLWFKATRVTINSTGVTAVKRWLFLSRTRRFDAATVARFETKAGMTSGSQVFNDLKLIAKDSEDSFAINQERFQQTGRMPPLKFSVGSPGGFTLASGIKSKPEADWLAQEMTKALGRQS